MTTREIQNKVELTILGNNMEDRRGMMEDKGL